MATLYDLAADYRAVEAMATDPDVPDVALLDTLEGIGGAIEIKAENICKIMESWTADAAAIDHEIRRLQARKKVLVNREHSLRDYLRRNMEATGISRIESPYFLITLAKARDVVNITDEDALPDQFCRIKRVPNKTAIMAALQAGEAVPGATIGEGQASLRIK